MKLQKGLLPPVVFFYTMARCLFIFLNIVDINAIGSFFKSEFNNLVKKEKKLDFFKKKPKLHNIWLPQS